MILDISPLIDESIAVWPGDTPFARTVNLDMAAGGNLTLSDIRTTVHVGAHTDAPSHYTAGGQDIAGRALDYYLGPCNLVLADVPEGEYELIALPLRIAGADGSPVRAVLRTVDR